MKPSIIDFCEKYCEYGSPTYGNGTKTYLELHPDVTLSVAANRASKILNRADVQEKLNEIRERRYKDSLGTRERIIVELMQNVKLARARGHVAAANKALELVGRELQMFVERREIKQQSDVAVSLKDDVKSRAESLLNALSDLSNEISSEKEK